MQIEAGAVGITCQKISEAEVFVNAGFKDLLITYNLLGPDRVALLESLRALAKIQVVADHPEVIRGLASRDRRVADPLGVLIEVDSGAHRCGIQDPSEVLALAKLIEADPGLTFEGLMTYPAPGRRREANGLLEAIQTRLSAQGIACNTVSSGGSPDMWLAHESSQVNEYRVGTYIYFDRSLLNRGVCQLEWCALTVIATVISVHGTRFMLDAGSKALTSDLMGCEGYGLILEYPEADIVALSEEHGHVDARRCHPLPKLGEQVSILPNHACPVSNLFDQVFEIDSQGQGSLVKVHARGKVG